jgi:16S rRNA processing protein RimM
MERGARAGEGLVCLGQIGAPHGVRGEVRLRSFTAEPEAIAAYGPLQTEDGRAIEIEVLRAAKDHFVAVLAGIHDRDAAAQLANAKLYAPRERLPQLADPEEFYYADLIGLAVVDRSGRRIGEVVALHNFGAGDLIEVRLDAAGRTELLAFNDANVPNVDVAAGTIVIDPPADWLSPEPDAREGDEATSLSGKRSG